MSTENLQTVSLDEDTESSDWTKQSWDLPPYMSKEFLDLDLDLDAFRESPVYKHAVEAGLIHDDEWVGDSVEEPAPASRPITRAKHIHIHLE